MATTHSGRAFVSMEDTTELEKLTLEEPSHTAAFSFPPYRRRPLRSRTYHTLIQILSHCITTEFPRPHAQGDSVGVESNQVTEENGPINHDKVKSTDVLAPSPSYKELENALAQETDIGKNKEFLGCQDGGVDNKQRTVQESDGMNSGMNGEQEAAQTINISVADILVDDNRTADCAVQIEKEQEDMNSILDFRMDDFGPTGQLKLDEEFSICDLSEVLDSCYGMDMVVESSKEGEDIKENSPDLVKSVPKESEHQLQVKEMELEKLISNLGSVDSFCGVSGDEDIEEGEISGEAGVTDDLLNALSEDLISLGDKTTALVHTSEDIVDKEKSTCKDEKGGRWRNDVSDSSIVNIVDIVNSDGDCKMAGIRSTATEMQGIHAQNVFCDSYMETRRFGPTSPCLESLPPSDKVLQENATEKQISDASMEDVDVNKKKRKKGPLTKERRAKKKRKERIKRAENNRKLGIKRLKLQPVLKPKTVTFCRHYLQGRCHEGEKCKFSHDTVPLTKSKPCSYFARQSCMKGDDCPFDHQLSKYPCDNHTLKGFCSRGSDCLFSHEIPAKQSCSMTSSASKPELKSEQHTRPKEEGSFMISKVTQPSTKLTSQVNNSNSSNNADSYGMFNKKVDAKFSSGGNAPDKRAEQLVEPLRTARQTPKGVSFLSHGGLSPSDTSKQKQDGSSPKAGDLSNEAHKVPVSINKLKEVSVVAAPKRPRGINFLSFTQSSLDDTSHKTFSNLFSSDYNEKEKSILGDFAEQRQTHSLSFDNGQISQNATENVQNTAAKLQGTIQMPSLSFGGSWDQSAAEKNAHMPSSLKTSPFSNTPSSVQKAVQSTLSFAAKFESNIKLNHSSSVGKLVVPK
ncbi:hypothetical protein ACJIZ3_015446 [Penstemon smallii]|uniref:C3H1-type domain-containing protein n=1 Tax=Penstemon smallii TaxID=265156 RepID=A0ABD3RMQ1_9LAMI